MLEALIRPGLRERCGKAAGTHCRGSPPRVSLPNTFFNVVQARITLLDQGNTGLIFIVLSTFLSVMIAL